MDNNLSTNATFSDSFDRGYREAIESGKFVRVDRWTRTFIKPLREANAKRILDLGCGVGNEVQRVGKEGFDVTGLDCSTVVIDFARKRVPGVKFIVGDMAKPLPFPDSCFDAVMSNVAAHMFSDSTTRALFAEVKRILHSEGLFLFHLNSTEDRSLRAIHHRHTELEPNFVLETASRGDSGTRHFFSREYLLSLLADWQSVNLEHVEILRHESTQQYERFVIEDSNGNRHDPSSPRGRGFNPIKRVWRGIARR